MTGVIHFLLNSLNSIWSALTNDPIKLISAIASTISALAAIGALTVGWKNLKKDTTRVSVIAKRAQNGPLILQQPQEEFLLFEVYNQGITPVVINEVGIRIPGKFWSRGELVNLVDLPHSSIDMRGKERAIGTLECIGLPGTIPARSMGIFLLCYSKMKRESNNCQDQSLSSSDLNFVGSTRLIKTSRKLQSCEALQNTCLRIIPYILTGSGERFVGKKSVIKLGKLGDVVT